MLLFLIMVWAAQTGHPLVALLIILHWLLD